MARNPASKRISAGQWRPPRAGPTVCKTVGSAYFGSNPTPATTCENGPLAAETRPGGPFLLVPPCVIVCRCRSWRSDRYGHMADSVRAKSGPWNRLLCRSVPVLSRYAGIRTARLTGACRASPGGRFSAVLLALGGGLVLFVPAAGAGFRISPRHPIEVGMEAVTECVPPAAWWKAGAVPWRATLRAGLDSARAASSCRKGSRCPLSGTRSGRAGHVPVVD